MMTSLPILMTVQNVKMLFERTETEANIHAKPLHLQFKATVRHSKFLGTLVQV